MGIRRSSIWMPIQTTKIANPPPSCPGTVVLAKSPEPFSFHRDPATPMQLAATPGPVTFSPASDKNSETEMIEEIVPEEVENMDTGENDGTTHIHLSIFY